MSQDGVARVASGARSGHAHAHHGVEHSLLVTSASRPALSEWSVADDHGVILAVQGAIVEAKVLGPSVNLCWGAAMTLCGLAMLYVARRKA